MRVSLMAGELLVHELSYHLDEDRVVVDRASPNHRYAGLLRDASRFDVQVVEDFDILAKETERHHDRGVFLKCSSQFADVRPQPRLIWVATAPLVSDKPSTPSELVCHQRRSLVQLLRVAALLRHRTGDTVGGEDKAGSFALFRREFTRCCPDLLCDRLDKQGMGVPRADVLDFGRIRSQSPLRLTSALDVPIEARLRAMGRQNETN